MQRAIKGFLAFVLVFGLLPVIGLTGQPERAFADEAISPSGKYTKEITGKLVTKKGKTSYRLKGGKKLKSSYAVIDGKTYYFDSKGQMATGWKKLSGEYYYFDRSTGVQKKSSKTHKAKVDGIELDKKGKAKKSTYNVDKIKTMMRARKIMLENTDPTDSKADKRKKMFKWVMKGYYKRYRTIKSTGREKGWELKFANDMFKDLKYRWGCCVSNAATFAFFAKECGYKDVYLCDDTSHAFVVINDKYYDTLFAEVYGFNNYYHASHKRAWRDYKAHSLKI